MIFGVFGFDFGFFGVRIVFAGFGLRGSFFLVLDPLLPVFTLFVEFCFVVVVFPVFVGFVGVECLVFLILHLVRKW